MLQDDLAGQEPSVAVVLPVTAASEAGQASAAGVGLLEVSGRGLLQTLSAAAGRQTVASELEVSLLGFAEESPDQKEVSGLEKLPGLVDVAGLQVLG